MPTYLPIDAYMEACLSYKLAKSMLCACITPFSLVVAPFNNLKAGKYTKKLRQLREVGC